MTLPAVFVAMLISTASMRPLPLAKPDGSGQGQENHEPEEPFVRFRHDSTVRIADETIVTLLDSLWQQHVGQAGSKDQVLALRFGEPLEL